MTISYASVLLSLRVFMLLEQCAACESSTIHQASYDVLTRDGNVEIRRYAPLVAAEVAVNGSRLTAGNEGFMLLARYVFGGNLDGRVLPMTSRVEQQRAGGQQWVVRFIMTNFTLDSLPAPLQNHAVRLNRIPAQKWVVLRFAGPSSGANLAEHEIELIRYIVQHQIVLADLSVKYAFYSEPAVGLGRNEVMMQLYSDYLE